MPMSMHTNAILLRLKYARCCAAHEFGMHSVCTVHVIDDVACMRFRGCKWSVDVVRWHHKSAATKKPIRLRHKVHIFIGESVISATNVHKTECTNVTNVTIMTSLRIATKTCASRKVNKQSMSQCIRPNIIALSNNYFRRLFVDLDSIVIHLKPKK